MEDPLEPLQMPPIGRARNALFRRLLDLVAMPASRLAHQDRHMVGDILLEVLFHAEETDREMCARAKTGTVVSWSSLYCGFDRTAA